MGRIRAVHISCSISVSDEAYEDFASHVAISHPVFLRGRRLDLANRILFVAIPTLGAVFASNAPLLASIIGCVGGLWCWYSWRRYPKKIAKAQVALRAENSGNGRLAELQLTVDEEAISVMGEHSQARVKWSGVQAWGEGTHVLFFSLNATQAVIVPKAGSAAHAIEPLRSYAIMKLGEPNKPLQPIARDDARSG